MSTLATVSGCPEPIASPMQTQIERFTLDLHRALRERNQARDALRKARIDALMRLVAASEFKDSDTGLHIMRSGRLLH